MQLFGDAVKLAVVVIPANDWAKRQLDITGPSIAAYADRIKADLIEIRGDCNPQRPMDNKYRVQEVTQVYDRTLYLDCDVFPTKIAPNIFEHCKGEYGMVDELNHIDHEFKETYIRECKSIGEYLGMDGLPEKVPNGGVLVFPKNANYYHLKDVQQYWCLDQFVLAYTVQPQWLSKIWNWGYIQPDWEEGLYKAYMIHTNGSSTSRRLRLLRRTVAEYGL